MICHGVQLYQALPLFSTTNSALQPCVNQRLLSWACASETWNLVSLKMVLWIHPLLLYIHIDHQNSSTLGHVLYNNNALCRLLTVLAFSMVPASSTITKPSAYVLNSSAQALLLKLTVETLPSVLNWIGPLRSELPLLRIIYTKSDRLITSLAAYFYLLLFPISSFLFTWETASSS